MRALPLVLLLLACSGGTIQGPERQAALVPPAQGPDQIRVRRLLVAFHGAEGADRSVERNRNTARERAHMLAGLARESDLSFRELIAEYGDVPPDTDDRSTSRIMTRGSDSFPAVVQRAAFRLEPGEVTRAIETPAGFVLIQREPDGEHSQHGPSEINARQIVISFRGAERAPARVTRTREQAESLARQLAATLHDRPSQWNRVRGEYSDERDRREIGVLRRGESASAFERAAFALRVSQISDPIPSPYGFHIVQRTE